ncbi:hypothetical protein [Pseudoduganella chitinolytica]|uniref:DUF397 domain-containing protein n=1 Tax=Pseudoduganella chitinolytica TaxID=34070 RepID=A0ABY8BFR6_9BURK|nr:hypothetical protein [Pseudoduganella chitinolytica]WEF34526.1 hypothetical protein PX653_07110 [Pseudoduganella chitinolytica]
MVFLHWNAPRTRGGCVDMAPHYPACGEPILLAAPAPAGGMEASTDRSGG